MVGLKVNLSGAFKMKMYRPGGAVHEQVVTATGREVASLYGRASRETFQAALHRGLEVFDEAIESAVIGNTPVWTGRLKANTYSTFIRDVIGGEGIRGDRIRWSLLANTYYARFVNRTASSRRQPNYFGRAVEGAFPQALSRCRQAFRETLS